MLQPAAQCSKVLKTLAARKTASLHAVCRRQPGLRISREGLQRTGARHHLTAGSSVRERHDVQQSECCTYMPLQLNWLMLGHTRKVRTSRWHPTSQTEHSSCRMRAVMCQFRGWSMGSAVLSPYPSGPRWIWKMVGMGLDGGPINLFFLCSQLSPLCPNVSCRPHI
jgi:hypothetical protein